MAGQLLLVSGCSGHTGQMAGQGAAVGGAAGAVGGLITGLVFGGNAAEMAARGAVWGASSGAVTGAVAGSQMDAAERTQRQRAAREEYRAKVGDDVFEGTVALANCRHDVAIGFGRTAARSKKKDHALAGLWLEAVSLGDRGDREGAYALLPDLVASDGKVASEDAARVLIDESLARLKEIRGEYNLPRECR